jgi:hypothetical protein
MSLEGLPVTPIRTLALAAAALAVATGAQAAATLSVSDGWSRPAVAGTNGVGYLTIRNGGKAAQTLVKVETPVAERVDMHSMSMAGGVMKMAKIDRLTVPAGGQVVFGPQGAHLMLMGLKKPLAVGDKVPATLTFASGEHVKTAFSVAVMPPSMD